jgi:hypothetical protein
MQKQTINQSSPETEFILCKNVSGATLSQGSAVYFDTASATDGYAVSGARTGQKYLFAGITAQALSNNSKGLVQTYGITSAYMVLASTAVSCVPGESVGRCYVASVSSGLPRNGDHRLFSGDQRYH